MTNRNGSDNSSEQASGSNHLLRLDLDKTKTPPSFFRCPISLEVMLSPVSLCTGVTYDRSSIKRWLDSGNTTCPATMQPLSSTDLVPNLTLRRLIHHWSDQYPPSLPDIAGILSDPNADDSYKLRLLSSEALCPSALVSLFISPETHELAVTLVSLFFSLDLVDENGKQALIAALLSDLEAAISGVVAVLKGADHSSSRVAAARVLEMLIGEATSVIAEKPDLVTELMSLIGESDAELVDLGLRCLMGLIVAGKKVTLAMVRMRVVPALTKVMEREEGEIPASAVEKAMRIMESVTRLREGRAAICAEAERCVAAVVGMLMKVGNEGREAALVVLWSVCCAGGGDRRAREAAAAVDGGLAKILVVMQGGCSPSAIKMAGDLLRVFRGNGKSLTSGACFDSKTMHIMPF